MTERERVARAICRTRCPLAEIHPCDAVLDGSHCQPEKCRHWHFHKDTADAAISAMSPAWRPIPAEVREGEEPWDGEPLLLWNGHWRGVGMYNEPNYEGDPIWVDEHTEFIEPGPTHYMPLPAPPSAEKG